MAITVRHRTAADLVHCARVLIEVHRTDGYPVEGVADPESWLMPTGLLNAWVGELNGAIVGHALMTTPGPADDAAALWIPQPHEPAATIAVLGRLFVGALGRGRGVGEQLTRAVMAHAKELGHQLVLDVMEKDQAAIRLYERLGWQHIGSTRHRFGADQETAAQCYAAP